MISDNSQKNGTNIQKLNLQHFEIIGLLGEGSYAEVYEVRNIKTQKMGVIKKLYKDQILNQSKHNEVYIERYMLVTYSQKHPGIITFQGSFQDEESLYFVLELCPYGDLSKLMEKCFNNPSFGSDLLTRNYIFQLCNIINFLHNEGITHLDIKPQNIVIDENKNLKLIDFATCYFYDKTKQPIKLAKELQQAAKMKEVKLQKSQLDVYFRPSFVGTPEYVSPEMLENSKASKEADLWAVGCIIYEFYYGKPPFSALSENAVFDKILSLDYTFDHPIDRYVPDIVKDIISRLLVTDPLQRCGASNIDQLFNHPYFDDVRSVQLWEHPLDVPLECEGFFQIGAPQRQHSMRNSTFLWMNNPNEISLNGFEMTSKTITPTETPERSPQVGKKLVFEDSILLVKGSYDSTDANISSDHFRARNLPHCMILLYGNWFWQLPKANILFIDKKHQRLVLNDFKKQKYLLIDQQTKVKQIGKSYEVERKGQYCIKFSNYGDGLDWFKLIENLKNECN